MAVQLAYAGAAFVAGQIIANLLSDDPDVPVQDEKPTTLSTRGAYLPLIIGRERVGAFFGWAGNRQKTTESTSSGGKGAQGSGVGQDVYFEDGAHFLCVGPGYALNRLWINGDVWEPDAPLTPDNFPDGSSVDVIIDEVDMGSMTIYWGFADSQVDSDFASDEKMGIESGYPYVMRAFWRNFRMGGVAQWALIEYDIEVRPFKSGWTRGLSWDAVPADFTIGTPWLNNFFGPSGVERQILRFVNNAGFNTKVIVAGDASGDYVVGERATITGSETGSNNDTYNVDAVLHLPGGAVNYPGPFELDNGFEENIQAPGTSNFLWVPSAGVTALESPQGVNIPESLGEYEDDVTSLYSWFCEYPAGSGTFGATSGTYGLKTRFTVFVSNDDRPDVFRLQMDGGAGVHFVQFDNVVDGLVVGEESNGAKGKVQFFPGWWALTMDYTEGDGSTPSSSSDTLNCRMIWQNASNNAVRLYNPLVSKSELLTENDITEITLDKVVASSTDFDGGQIQHWAAGLGPQGPNPAHVLYQLLFAQYPHGAAQELDDYFVYADDGPLNGRFRILESLSILAATQETLNANVTIKDGDTFRAAIDNFLLDMGWMISWDSDIGLFVFTPIRDPNNTALVGTAGIPELPAEMFTNSYPTIENSLAPNNANRQSFTYREALRNFKNDSVVTGSDSSILDEGSQRRNDTTLFIARDRDTAEKIAARRTQEATNQPAVVQMTCNHEASRLYPGLPFKVIGLPDIAENDIYRVMEVTPDPLSGEVAISAIFDNYSLRESSVTSNLALTNDSFGGNFQAGVNDLALALVELPAALSNTSNAFTVLRIRDNRRIENADIQISRDGTTYVPLARQSHYCGGGTLLEPWADTEGDVEGGPLFRALGPDTADLALNLSAADFQNGRQVVYMGGEWFFVRSLTAGPDNTFRLTGLNRAKFGSSAASHAIGDNLFIFNPMQAPRYLDVLAQKNQTIIVKSAPKASTRVPLASASTAQTTITGVAGPSKATIHSGDETDLAATYPAADYAGSKVLVQNSVSSMWSEYYSDGASWNQVM